MDAYERLGFELSALVSNNAGHYPRLVECDGILLRRDTDNRAEARQRSLERRCSATPEVRSRKRTIDWWIPAGFDVGPETRQVLARKRDRFDGPYSLTLGDELVRCQVPERAVWASLIVVDAPGFDLRFRILDRRELMDVQALVSEPSVKRFDEGIFHGFARANEIQLHPTLIGPVFERA